MLDYIQVLDLPLLFAVGIGGGLLGLIYIILVVSAASIGIDTKRAYFIWDFEDITALSLVLTSPWTAGGIAIAVYPMLSRH